MTSNQNSLGGFVKHFGISFYIKSIMHLLIDTDFLRNPLIFFQLALIYVNVKKKNLECWISTFLVH